MTEKELRELTGVQPEEYKEPDPDDMPETRKCTRCKKEFPLHEDYFARDGNLKYGLCYKCHACNRQDSRNFAMKRRRLAEKRRKQKENEEI